jgi:hypothetical protein
MLIVRRAQPRSQRQGRESCALKRKRSRHNMSDPEDATTVMVGRDPTEGTVFRAQNSL